MRGHGVVAAANFDMTIGMDGARARFEEGEGLGGQRRQGGLVGFEKVSPDLAARRAVDPQARDRPVPMPQVRVHLFETVESAALEGVVLDVPATSLLLAGFSGVAGPGRQPR